MCMIKRMRFEDRPEFERVTLTAAGLHFGRFNAIPYDIGMRLSSDSFTYTHALECIDPFLCASTSVMRVASWAGEHMTPDQIVKRCILYLHYMCSSSSRFKEVHRSLRTYCASMRSALTIAYTTLDDSTLIKIDDVYCIGMLSVVVIQSSTLRAYVDQFRPKLADDVSAMLNEVS